MFENVPHVFFSYLPCPLEEPDVHCVSYLFLSLLIVVVPINGHVDLKASLTPPLITHTAATPMPVPKISGGEDLALGYESRRGSSVSVEPGCHEKAPVSTV